MKSFKIYFIIQKNTGKCCDTSGFGFFYKQEYLNTS